MARTQAISMLSGASTPASLAEIYGLVIISIHAPRGGSDELNGQIGDYNQKISIHAPRGGSD